MSSPPSSSPSCPRAVGAADRFVVGSPSPGSDPVPPAALFKSFVRAFGSSWPGVWPSEACGLAVVPATRCSTHQPGTTRQRPRGRLRQATTSGLPLLRVLNHVPSGAIRARRWLSTRFPGPSGSAFPLKTGSVFLLGPTFWPSCLPYRIMPCSSTEKRIIKLSLV